LEAKSHGSGWAPDVSSCAYAAPGSGAVEGDADADADADALADDCFSPDGVALALGVGVALGLDDADGAWMHHDDFVTSLVIPFLAVSAAARLG
jgi:hypothetical protein